MSINIRNPSKLGRKGLNGSSLIKDGINGEPTEFEWNIFPGFTALQLCRKVTNLLSKLGETPETFTGRILPWTSLICVSSPKCVYMCVKRCPSQTPNAFICVSPNAFICVSPNAFICVSPNAFICVSPNVSADGARFARLPLLASLARFLTG